MDFIGTLANAILVLSVVIFVLFMGTALFAYIRCRSFFPLTFLIPLSLLFFHSFLFRNISTPDNLPEGLFLNLPRLVAQMIAAVLVWSAFTVRPSPVWNFAHSRALDFFLFTGVVATIFWITSALCFVFGTLGLYLSSLPFFFLSSLIFTALVYGIELLCFHIITSQLRIANSYDFRTCLSALGVKWIALILLNFALSLVSLVGLGGLFGVLMSYSGYFLIDLLRIGDKVYQFQLTPISRK